MTMIEMAHEKAAELGLGILVRTLEDGEMIFALEYPEEAGGPRLGLAIRVRGGQHTEEAATWLLGQMASAELQAEADRLAADETPLVLELTADGDADAEDEPAVAGDTPVATTADSGEPNELKTRVLTALLSMSILLEEMKGDDLTMDQVAARITEVGNVLNGTAKTGTV